MTKVQFWTLNFVSLALVASLLGQYQYSRQNNRLGQAVANDRAAINQARQIEAALDNMAKRIALGSEKDPKLRDLLLKYGMSVTLEVDGKKKTYP